MEPHGDEHMWRVEGELSFDPHFGHSFETKLLSWRAEEVEKEEEEEEEKDKEDKEGKK